MTGENDNLSNDQFGDTAGVAEGRVEDSNSIVGSKLQVDLVSSNAKAADDDQVLRFLEDSCGELSFRTNANDVDISAPIVSMYNKKSSFR